MKTSLKQVEQAATVLKKTAWRYSVARDDLRQAIREARDEHTLAEIGKVLGMTRQSVHELLKR